MTAAALDQIDDWAKNDTAESAHVNLLPLQCSTAPVCAVLLTGSGHIVPYFRGLPHHSSLQLEMD